MATLSVPGLRPSWLLHCVATLQGRALQPARDSPTWKREFAEVFRDLPRPTSVVERQILRGLIAELALQHASQSGLIQSEYVTAVSAAAETLFDGGDETLHPKVALALKIIETEPAAAHPRLKPIAEAVGLSSWHLSRLVKSEIGCTWRDYMREVRIRRAAALLVVAAKSVKEVAAELGYHPGTFTRAFRRRYGQTPSQWRRSHGLV